MASPTFIDLDAIEVPEVVVKLGDKQHKMVPLSVEAFIAGVKDSQDLGTTPDFATEFGVVTRMILRSFPTMSEEELRKMPMASLNKLLTFTQSVNGHDDVSKEAEKEAEGNA